MAVPRGEGPRCEPRFAGVGSGLAAIRVHARLALTLGKPRRLPANFGSRCVAPARTISGGVISPACASV